MASSESDQVVHNEQDQLFSQLESTVDQLETSPNNVQLIQTQITLMNSLGMTLQAMETTLRLSALIMLHEKQWLDYFDLLIPSQALSVEHLADVLERFDQAEQDYISLAILVRHVEFILSAASILDHASIRQLLRTVTFRGKTFLASSHLLWQPWLEWEMSLEDNNEHVHQVFLERISQPHSEIEATSAAYSSFCSARCPQEYETRMVQLTAASRDAKFKWSGEKRYQKTREELETALDWDAYVRWETDTRTKHSDEDLTRGVFERAIASASSASAANPAYKEVEIAFWQRYAAWAEDDQVIQRAVRACPGSGRLWARSPDANVDFALGLGLLTGAADIAELFVAQAAAANRQQDSDLVIALLGKGLSHVEETGASTLRLEKFLLEWAEAHPDHLTQALSLISRPFKPRLASFQMTCLHAGVETRQHNIEGARQIYQKAISRTDMDWPEAVYEAYLLFEMVHGDGSSLSKAEKSIQLEQLKVAKRRAAQEAHAPVTYVPVQGLQDVQAVQESEAVQQVSAESDPAVVPESVKPDPLKRDREHTTILVTGLVGDKIMYESVFSQYGHIREITLLEDAAMVEFRSADAVAGALTRDGKKHSGYIMRISMLWRSTLFVANFSRDTDDESIRGLFQQYGRVLQTRWPSRKYADSRRFCYVVMGSPATAQEALVLNGMKMGDFPLSVAISDPTAKVKRTDADGQKRTLFVGGLKSDVTEGELEELFRPFGQTVHIKLGFDPVKKVGRGFAFVEMASEAEAQASVTLSGTKRKGKILKVEISDPNHQRATPGLKRDRTVRLHELPQGVQEGLLQQALEKIVPVKRVEIFAASREALVELPSAKEAGLLLLRPEPFAFNGKDIPITRSDQRHVPNVDIMIPRAARRGGKIIPKPRAPPVALKGTGETDLDQDAFRDLVKRKADDNTDNDTKRRKVD